MSSEKKHKSKKNKLNKNDSFKEDLDFLEVSKFKKISLINIFMVILVVLCMCCFGYYYLVLPNITLKGSKSITIEYDDYCVVVCPHNNIPTVVHECGHIANMIWKYIGYTPIRDNDEVDQYLRTYLFEEINKIINKHLSK